MGKSYKVKTYSTLHPWISLHEEIIEQYQLYPNKAEFVKLALEHFAESGFPGIQIVKPSLSATTGPDISVITRDEEDQIQQMTEELEDLC